MKRLILIVTMLALGLGSVAQNDFSLGLIPTPQRVEISSINQFMCNLDKIKVITIHVDRLPVERNMDQAYQIIFKGQPGGRAIVTVRYVGHDGLTNAFVTIEQLKKLHTEVPCMTITDWPAYKYRGWMDDISRGPVPHQAYRQRQWETLHGLKFNYCHYYTEHTLYQPEYPDLAPAYAAECKPHDDEVINLQLFAHAEETLRIPFYQNIMDSKTNFDPSVDATYVFLRNRIAAAYKRIPNSPFFIINCDETEQLGTGRAKKLVDSLGADQVYVDFINRCYQIVKEEGRNTENGCRAGNNPRVAMWGDIVAKNPDMMKQLPNDMTYIMWAYEPIDSFTHLIKPFKEQGNPFWVAASTGHSATMTSTPQRYVKNIANLFRDGNIDGAEGAMLTCWDDNGEALFDNSWHAQYWAAEMAWNPLKTNDPEELRQREEQFNKNFERLFYGDTGKVKDLYTVGAMMYDPIIGDWYNSAALMEPLLNFNPDNTSEAMRVRYFGVGADFLNNITIDSAANPHAHYAVKRIHLTSYKCYLRQLIHQELTGKNIIRGDSKTVSKVYLDALFDLKREYLRLWDQENGDYERYVVMNRYDDLAREVLELDCHVFMEVKAAAAKASASENDLAAQTFPKVTLRTLYGDKDIYYTLDGSEPTTASDKYSEPFPLERSATIRAITYNIYGEGVVSEQYLLSHLGMGSTMTLATPFSTYKSIYSGGGNDALIDGQLGSNTTYADGHWQGYWGDSIDATIDFGVARELHTVSMRFMQNTFDWILAPTKIKVYTSIDGQQWTLAADKPFDMDPRETGMRLKNYTVELPTVFVEQPAKKVKSSKAKSANHEPEVQKYRYIRVVVPNPGPLPTWHTAPGQPSYLFTDEIIIK